MILKPFDPWKSALCTCPAKLSLNPYTGCPHGCLYCYATSYIPHFQEPRPKVDLERRLKREASKVKPGCLVTMSSSSDPYPHMERDLQITRGCLEILKSRGLKVQVVTKSDLVCRDADLLSEMDSAVSITITTIRDDLTRMLEPEAPPTKRRLEAIRILRRKGVPVFARIDPIIPGINDSEIEDLVNATCEAGAQHITSSTYKARPDSWKRICSAFPSQAESLKTIFEKGCRVGGSRYMQREIRESLMLKVETAAIRNGVTFASCREGLAIQRGVLCDGSHLMGGRI
ncbi:MAG TPA: radical SAM protein [Methanotrichaceae archaeon]|nr:radical SAM protein [Methanotrichaceae archaeon]